MTDIDTTYVQQGSTKTPKATFEDKADQTIERVKGIYAQRKTQYKDSWALSNQSARLTNMSLEIFGYHLQPEQVRILQASVLCDIKDSRLIGPYNSDTLLDSIAYRSFLTGLIEEYNTPK